MSGCAAFAQVVDPTRIEAELLPQWWEQVNNILQPGKMSQKSGHIERPRAKCRLPA